jgi:hypothetical protein
MFRASGKLVVSRITVHQQQVFIHATSTPMPMLTDRVRR